MESHYTEENIKKAQENVQNFNKLDVVDIKEINHLKADGAM